MSHMPCWHNFRRPDFERDSIEEKEYDAAMEEERKMRARAYGVYEEEEEEEEEKDPWAKYDTEDYKD